MNRKTFEEIRLRIKEIAKPYMGLPVSTILQRVLENELQYHIVDKYFPGQGLYFTVEGVARLNVDLHDSFGTLITDWSKLEVAGEKPE
jgi:hypothetical protein